MRKLIIEQTANSPKVNFDPDRNLFEISGESRPPDVTLLYSEIMNWLGDFLLFIGRSKENKTPVVFNLDFEYFNSSSAKYILDFCKQIAGARSKGRNVGIRWHYEKDDYDMLEAGKKMSKIAMIPFEFSQKDE